MDAEVLCALFHQEPEALEHLLAGKPVFGVLRLVHDKGGDREAAARVEPAADRLRNAGQLFQIFNVRDVIKIDVRAELVGELIIRSRRDIRREHDLAAGESAGVCHLKLGERGAVRAAALFFQNFENKGIRGRLDRKILAEALVPCECLPDKTGIFADAPLVVNVERSRESCCNLLRLFLGEKRFFDHLFLLLFSESCFVMPAARALSAHPVKCRPSANRRCTEPGPADSRHRSLRAVRASPCRLPASD